MVSSKNKSP